MTTLRDLKFLRSVLARELDTISEYEHMAAEVEDPRLKAFFGHLAKEEKEHVSEAMRLIHEMDHEQLEEWEEVDTREEHFVRGPITHYERAGLVPKGPAEPAPAPTPSMPTAAQQAAPMPENAGQTTLRGPMSPAHFTVGSLRTKKS